MKSSQLVPALMASAGIRFVHLAAQTAAIIIMGRTLGAEQYGLYAYALAIVTIISMPLRSGGATVMTRFSSTFSQDGNFAAVRYLWVRFASWIVGYALLCIALVVFFVEPIAATSNALLIFYSLPLLLFLPLSDSLGGGIRGLGRTIIGQLPEFVIRPVMFLVLLGGMAVVHGPGLNASDAMFSYLMAAIAAVVVAAGCGGWLLPRSNEEPIRGESLWLRALVPLSFAAGMFILNAQADLVLLGWLLSDTSVVGVYRAVAQGAALASLPVTAMNLIAAPEIVRHYNNDAREALQRLVTNYSNLTFLGCAGIALLLILLGESILGTVLGPEFVPGYTIMLVLLAAQILSAGFGPVGMVLGMTGRERKIVIGVTAAAIVNVGLNVWLIPIYDAMGAAVATLVSVLVWNTILYVSATSDLGIICRPRLFRRG